jgi:hypothetical protein
VQLDVELVGRLRLIWLLGLLHGAAILSRFESLEATAFHVGLLGRVAAPLGAIRYSVVFNQVALPHVVVAVGCGIRIVLIC